MGLIMNSPSGPKNNKSKIDRRNIHLLTQLQLMYLHCKVHHKYIVESTCVFDLPIQVFFRPTGLNYFLQYKSEVELPLWAEAKAILTPSGAPLGKPLGKPGTTTLSVLV